MRVFVNEQIVPDAVAGSVVVVEPKLPKGKPGKCVELMTACSIGKLRRNERDKAFQNRRIAPAYRFVGDRQEQGSGNVCCAIFILST